MGIKRNNLYWLVSGLILSVIPYSQRLPIWVMVLFFAICFGKFAWHNSPRLKTKTVVVIKISLFILTIFGVAGIHIQFGTIFGLNAGSALLVLLASLKFMEIQRQRDFHIACLLGYFLIMINFLYTQTLSIAFYMAFNIFVMTLSLVSLNDIKEKISFPMLGKISASLLLQSIPVMLILFLLFPRVTGPLWGLPNDTNTAITGIDDEMSPGSISHLIQSDEIAFRVNFKDVVPDQSQLYWRGLVLMHSDGFKWTRSKEVDDFTADMIQPLSSAISYTITLEPHNRKWLYALDLPGRATQQGRLTADFQLLSKESIKQRTRYEMYSYLNYSMPASAADELTTALRLPEDKHPQTKALMQQWLSKGLSQQQIIEQALQLFNQDEYYYTLTPPVLKNDPVDQFMFQTKQGYCEHYTNAFVVMMRAAGIPARVVLGYQGGDYNPVGDYWIVHQRNAHAWAEVWNEQRGWVRIDPTAAVSPLRIQEGINSIFPDGIVDIPLIFSQLNLTIDLWRQLGYRWDALNNLWYQLVINYDSKQQTAFLHWFGIQNINWSNMILLILGLTTLLMIYIAAVLLKTRLKHQDPVKTLYDQFCKKLSYSGIAHIAYEGPLDFAQRAASQRTDLAAHIHAITDAYIAVRYGSDLQKIGLLRKRIKTFKV